jgi:RNA polymerase sigma factor (sigma-70 family)
VAALSPGEQAVITLRSFEDLPYEQVATIVGIKAATARVIYHRALVKLRAHLGEPSEDA